MIVTFSPTRCDAPMRWYASLDAAPGTLLLLANDTALTHLHFVEGRYAPRQQAHWRHAPDHPVLARALLELREYFAGQRRSFETPVELSGTSFQQRVWRALLDVPYGDTASYAQVAAAAYAGAGVRAVGAAIGRNPVSILVPCHRIIGSSGELTGYAGGLPRKRALLALERDACGGAQFGARMPSACATNAH